MTRTWKSVLLAATIACFAYWFCLRWIFPGYFQPLVPHHSDLYIPAGLLNRSVWNILTFPRPLAHLILQMMGLLGVAGSIAAVVVTILAGVVLTVCAIRRITGAWPGVIGVFLYCVLLFAHPEFYFHHRHDVPAALSYLLLMGAVLALFGKRPVLSVVLIAITLAFTKETYYLSLLVVIASVSLLQRKPWRSILSLASLTLLVECAAFVYNTLRYRHFLAESLTGSAPYSVSLRPADLLSSFWFYLRELASPLGALIVITTVLLLWRDRERLGAALLLVLAGLASLLPHAVLPHHLETQYAWVAAPLFFAPVLLLRWKGIERAGSLVLAVTVAGWLVLNRPDYDSGPHRWTIEQEQANGRILEDLPKIEQSLGSRILISGLRASYHPWLFTDYIQHRFGSARHWTFIVPSSGPQRTDRTVTLETASFAHSRLFDTAVLFQPDGRLLRVVRYAELQTALRTNPETILAPGVVPHLKRLQTEPGHFLTLLSTGIELLDGGWPERAVPYLQRAIAADPSNSYGHYFLGRAMAAQKNYAAARACYRQAIALDGKPPNSAFREALAQLPKS